MPIWAPPTPPQDENDVYIDHSLGLLYDPSSMMESQLPPVYIKKEPKKIKVDHVRKLKPHLPKGDAQSHVPHTIAPPQSLFNRPSAALLRMRREAKQQKLRAMAGKQVVKPLPIVHRPSTSVEAHTADRPEWLINEDWALLQAVQALQELPLTLQAVVPGHIINWDLVSDVVNACGHTYRSPKQCRSRYEGVIIPREEGKILYDTNPKKQKKSKGIYRTKSNRPMKTSQLHVQDGNSAHTQLYNSKFDLIKAAVSKKQPYLKQVLNNPLLKNPKHSAVLNDFGIGYEKPMSPVQVAAKRAERIAREKKAQQEQQQQRLQAAAAAKQQQQAAAIAQAVATATTATVMTTGPSNRTTLGPGSLTLTRTTNSATSGLVITTPRIVSTVRGKELKQSGPITRTTLGPGSTPIRTVNSAASSIVVNTPPGAVSAVTGHTFATINKRMSQGVATIATVAGTANAQVTPTVASSLAQVVRAQAGTRTSVVTLPSTAGIITSQVRGVTTATVVMTTSASSVQARSTPTLTGAQLTVASMKNLTQLTPAQISQLALFKQQALRQQQLQQQQQSSQLKQQLKQADIKRLQQAQAQAQAAQVQAQAQAQAAQQQVTAQALQAVQKTGVTATVVGTTAATVVSAAQAQLTARQQQVAKLTQQRVAQSKVKRTVSTLPVSGVKVSGVPMQQAVQQKQTTLTRPTTLKESDVAALIKLQQQRIAQSKLKGTITTIPVSGVKVSSVPMQVKGVLSGSQGQKAGQATAMKALTIQPGGKLSLQQILQMQQAQKVQQAAVQQAAAQQQKLLGVKAQLLQKQVAQVQQVVTSGGAIRVSSPVVVTSSVPGHQQMVQSGAVQAGTVHQVQGLQVSQGQLAQGVRLQQVTSSQGGTSTVVQRVAQVAQSPMTTVRQQLGLQQQVKAAAAAQGTTLSIQQAIKPVTLIQTGASLLPGTKTATASSAQLLQNKMLAQIVTSAAAAQQSTPTSTVSVTQLARVVAPPATVQAVQVSQPQQTLTVESVAIAAPVQPKQEEVKEAVPSLTTTVKPPVAQPVIAAQAQQAQVSVTAQPSQPQQQQQQQQATAQPIRTVTAAQLQQAQAALRQQQQQQQAAEAQSQQGSSQRTSPYAMRLRKPSQTNN